jgi:hypothetical protein
VTAVDRGDHVVLTIVPTAALDRATEGDHAVVAIAPTAALDRTDGGDR